MVMVDAVFFLLVLWSAVVGLIACLELGSVRKFLFLLFGARKNFMVLYHQFIAWHFYVNILKHFCIVVCTKRFTITSSVWTAFFVHIRVAKSAD